MLVRIWRTGVESHRWDDYARFEREHSQPMFSQQPGCRGVLFLRLSGGTGAAACSFWDDREAIDRLATSPTYRETVARLTDSGLLTGTQSVEVFTIASGALDSLPGIARFK